MEVQLKLSKTGVNVYTFLARFWLSGFDLRCLDTRWTVIQGSSGFVLYPYVFVAGPNKHDCSRRLVHGCTEISNTPVCPPSRKAHQGVFQAL